MRLSRKLHGTLFSLISLLAATTLAGCLSPGGIAVTQGSINVSLTASSAANLPGSKVTSASLSIAGSMQSSGSLPTGH
jgi:hypothetical protein